MNGRQDKKENDLFFLCSLIDYVARQTKNKRAVVVNAIGKEKLQHLYNLADVYHCENMDKVTAELVEKYSITHGDFDNVGTCQFNIPTHWDIGKVYQRLIVDLCNERRSDPVETLIEVYNSWITKFIDNYNSSMYYENRSYLLASYLAGHSL